MAVQLNTPTGLPATSTPPEGAPQGEPVPEGAPQLGVGVPLPVGPDGKPLTTGQSTQGADTKGTTAARETSQTQHTEGTAGTEAPKQPAVNLFGNDNVERSTGKGDVEGSKPFSDYSLPESDTTVKNQPAAETDNLHASLATSVTEVAQALFQEGGVAWVQERTEHLAAHPQEGVLTQVMADPAMQALFTDTLLKGLAAGPLGGAIPAGYPEGAQAVLDAGRAAAVDVVLGRFLGQDLSLGGFVQNLVGTGFSKELVGKAGGAEGIQRLFGGVLPKDGFSLVGPDGKLKSGALGSMLSGKGAALLEASLEFYIGVCGRLIKGDVSKDIDCMTARLNELKEEKQGIIGRIIELEGSIVGTQQSMANAAKEAREAQEKTKAWSLAGAIIALVIVIVVAIVVTVFSCGTAGPAAAAGVAAMTGVTVGAAAAAGAAACTIALTLGVSLAVATGLAIACVVCVIVIAVITFIQTLPQILEACAMVAEACGNKELAASLREGAEDIQKALDGPFGKVLMAISIACALFTLVIGIAVAAGSAAANAASAAAQAGSQVAANAIKTGVEAARAAWNLMQNVATFVNAAGMVLSGAARVAASAAMKDMAKAMRELEILRERLAEVELEIKQLMQQIETKKNEEQQVKESIEDRQEMESKVMENLNKAAESYKQILSAAALI